VVLSKEALAHSFIERNPRKIIFTYPYELVFLKIFCEKAGQITAGNEIVPLRSVSLAAMPIKNCACGNMCWV
jgi:hypothetical protein